MPKTLTTGLLNSFSDRFGNAFYLLESESFEQNYKELTAAFKAYYPKFNIAYSYKTNYTPLIGSAVMLRSYLIWRWRLRLGRALRLLTSSGMAL